MSIHTFKHCLICYKKDASEGDPGESTNVRELDSNAEMCRRFCTLSSRYLNLNKSLFNSDRTVNTKWRINVEAVCNECVDMVSSFSDLYQQYEYLQIQLDHRLHEVAKMIKFSDKKNSPRRHDREALNEKLVKLGSSLSSIDNYRANFVKAVKSKKAAAFPRLRVKKEYVVVDDDDDDLFIAIRVPKKSRRNKVTAVDTSNTTQELSCNSLPERKKMRLKDNIPTGVNTDNELKADPPSTLPKSSIDSGDNSVDSGEFQWDTFGVKTELAKTESSLVDSNDQSGNCDQNKDGGNLFSSEIEFDKICAEIFKWNENDVMVQNVKNDANYHADPQHPGKIVCVSDETDNRTSSNAKNVKLYYTCPFMQCGKKFKTMTRMTIHQQSTGHRLNAIVTLITR